MGIKTGTSRIAELAILFGMVLTLAALTGCGTAQPRTERVTPGPQASPSYAALIDGAPLAWTTLRDGLSERAGGEILEEARLDLALRKELDRLGLDLTADQLRLEREALQSPGSESLRRQRGLGPARVDSAVWRSAALKAIARTTTPAGEDLDARVRFEAALRYGSRTECRVLTLPSPREADRIRIELENTPAEYREARFVLEVLSSSVGPRVETGGLLSIISADQTIPAALRRAVDTAEPGSVTTVAAVPQGYAVALILRDIEAQTPSASELEELRTELRQSTLREAMDQIARRLLRQQRVTVLDPSLRWSSETSPDTSR